MNAASSEKVIFELREELLGGISIEGNFLKVEDFLKLSAVVGHQLNHGWELNGQVRALTKWEWKKPFSGNWNGRISFYKANLTVAGLNQPVKIAESQLDFDVGRRIARVISVEAFGGMWTGNIEEAAAISQLDARHRQPTEADSAVAERHQPEALAFLEQSFARFPQDTTCGNGNTPSGPNHGKVGVSGKYGRFKTRARVFALPRTG
jgi:hypothetical protein